MEVVPHTIRGAPLTIGGIPSGGTIRGAIEIPKALSLLVAFDPNAEVRGLDIVSVEDRPPVAATHLSFDAMVGSAFFMLAVALAWLAFAWRRVALARWVIAAIALAGGAALVALQAGWYVTEFGRQPWIAVGVQRTSEAVTIAPNLDIAFYGFSIIYVVLGITCVWLLRRVGAAKGHAP